MNRQQALSQLLVAGLDDWLHLAEVEWILRKAGAKDVIQSASQLLGELAGAKLIEVGDLSRSGFVAWDVTPDEAMRRLELAWRNLGRPTRPGDVAWLALTSEGKRRAQQISPLKRGVDSR